MIEAVALATTTAAAGLAVGSFAVTAGVRQAKRRSILAGRSACDHCGVRLGFAETVPIVSYLQRRGACSHCGRPIDPLHLLGEIAGLAVVLSAVSVAAPLPAAGLAALGLLMIASSATDLRAKRLPDGYTLAIALLAAGLAAGHGLTRLGVGLAWAVGTGLVLLTLAEAGRRRRGVTVLGLGDIKLLAALAIWLGPATPLMVLVAAMAGLIGARWLSDETGRTPFGPMIALGGWGVGIALEAGWSWL